MARGINKWIGIGNCCADPEIRYAASGSAIANVTVACGDEYKDKTTREKVDKTEFVRVVFFNRLGEIAGEYLKKGSQVYIEGKLQTRKWQDKDGQDRYTTEIVANEMQMLGGRGESKPAKPSSNPSAQADDGQGADDFDDDIPF